MTWFYIVIKPDPEIGGVRYFGVIKADDVADALKRFQPYLDSINKTVKHSVKGLSCERPFVVDSISHTDYETVSQKWSLEMANKILAALAKDE
jgi:hypothetical protein